MKTILIAVAGALIFSLSIISACSQEKQLQQGAPGIPGAPGTDAKIQSAQYCHHVETINGKQISYFYEAILFATGVRYVSCSAGYTMQSTANFYYSADDADAAKSKCSVIYSLPGNTLGTWRFSQTPDLQVEYSDPGDSSDGHTYIFSADDCK